MNTSGSPESIKDKSLGAEIRYVNLKTNLKRLLSEVDINATKLCKATGVPKSTISDWLMGNSPKNIKQIKAVADFFKVTIDELVFSESIKKDSRMPESLGAEFMNFGTFDVYLKKKI